MVLADLVMDLEDFMAMACMEATSGRDRQMRRKIVHCPYPRGLLNLSLVDMDMVVMAIITITIITHIMDMDIGNHTTPLYTKKNSFSWKIDMEPYLSLCSLLVVRTYL